LINTYFIIFAERKDIERFDIEYIDKTKNT
jgi:hypothetical protein